MEAYTRKEAIIKAACEGREIAIEPKTREEYFLVEICKKIANPDWNTMQNKPFYEYEGYDWVKIETKSQLLKVEMGKVESVKINGVEYSDFNIARPSSYSNVISTKDGLYEATYATYDDDDGPVQYLPSNVSWYIKEPTTLVKPLDKKYLPNSSIIVNVTQTDGVCTADKTYADIKKAIDSGAVVMASFCTNDSASIKEYLPLSFVSGAMASFEKLVGGISENTIERKKIEFYSYDSTITLTEKTFTLA